MFLLFRKHKPFLVVLGLALLVLLISRCVSSPENQPDLRGQLYAGAESCRNCHASVFENHAQTAHAQTSRPPTSQSIKGRFDSAHNAFVFSDEWKVVMERGPEAFLQTAYRNGEKAVSFPFDIVVGSGRKAQTYLYFRDSTVYQLPISYFVPEHTWANSPNFPSGEPKFDRLVPSGCFGCHSSAVGVHESYRGMQKLESFEKGKIIYGIDCERCHGPAAEHVTYQEAHPGSKEAKYITSLRSLNRQQSVDLCGICHSGTKNMQRPAFGFRPGAVREDYFFPDYGEPLPENRDVHGNQYALMKGSPCYIQSQTLTCTSCHSPHQKERENLNLFSQRCLACHQEVAHSFVANKSISQAAVSANCIDCHMPQKASAVITLLTKQQTAARPDSIRTHLIRVYAEETEKFLVRQRLPPK